MAQCTGSLLWEHPAGTADTSIALSPEGTRFTVGSSNGITVFDINGTREWDVPLNGNYGIAMSAGGQSLAAGGSALNVYDPDGSIAWKWSNGYFIFDVDINPGGSEVVACSDDATLYSFNLTDDTSWNISMEEDLYSVARSAGGDYTVCGSENGHIYLFNSEPRQLWKYRTGGAPIRDIAISSDGARIAAVSGDGMLYYFSRSGRMLLSKSIGRSNQVAIAGDGSLVASGGDSIGVYSGDGEPVWSHDTGTGVSGIDLAASGTLLAASDQNTVYVFSLDCGDHTMEIPPSPDEDVAGQEIDVPGEAAAPSQATATTPAKSGADHLILGMFSLFCVMVLKMRK